MKRSFTIIATILFVMAGCTGCKQSDAQSDDFITIDVTAKYPKKELILQDFLNVEYIPLETNDEFITAGLLRDVGKSIVLVKNNNQAGAGDIFLFDRNNGKGLRKINRRGQGGEEYTNILDIILDEDKGEMFVNCGSLSKIFVYDLFGNFKRSFKYMDVERDPALPVANKTIYLPMYNFDQNNLIVQDFATARFAYGNLLDTTPRNIFWIISKEDGSVTKEIQIPFEKKIFMGVMEKDGRALGFCYNYGLIRYRDRWILTESSADTIYSYSADHSMKPFIVRTPSVQSMEPEVFLFPGVITDRYYFLQAVKKEYIPEVPRSNLRTTDLMYDTKEKKTFEYVVYNDDFIEKRSIYDLVDAPEVTVINNDEIAFAERIEAFELVEAYEKGKLKGKLKEIAATLDEESNPVIMLAKYKKNMK